MKYVVEGTFRGVTRVLKTVDIRGDGSVSSEKFLKWANRDSAEAFAAAKRAEFPDTTYRVIEKN